MVTQHCTWYTNNTGKNKIFNNKKGSKIQQEEKNSKYKQLYIEKIKLDEKNGKKKGKEAEAVKEVIGCNLQKNKTIYTRYDGNKT